MMGADLGRAGTEPCSSTARRSQKGGSTVRSPDSSRQIADVGIGLGTPVVEAVGAEAKSRFTGRIPKVTIEVK
jgi:arylsulfatase